MSYLKTFGQFLKKWSHHHQYNYRALSTINCTTPGLKFLSTTEGTKHPRHTEMCDAKELKKVACTAIDKQSAQLSELSQVIWSNPEICFTEQKAHEALTNFLEQTGFTNLERSFVFKTGFRAVHGSSNKETPHVGVLCEYDALPEIGHACGHNLIAEAGAGAAVGIKAALDHAKLAGKDLGKLTVLGTPAEEGEGGKLDFIEQRVFDNIDLAMMVHPWPIDAVDADGFLARIKVAVKYHGKASHAAGFPWEGVNALDAAVMAYTSISVLRQQCKPTWRIHGVIVNGGVKPNIIPEETELDYCFRAPTMKEVYILKEKAVACFEAAAQATGCRLELIWHAKPYENVVTNPTLGELYRKNATSLGINFEDQSAASVPTASTDMGNVSHVVPSIHPFFYIGDTVLNHTREFTAVAGDPKAQPFTLNQAKVMAMVAIDVLCQPDMLTTIKAQFNEQMEKEKA